MNSAPFVAGQAGALKCTANADDAHDDVAVIFVDSHTTVPKGEVHSVSRLRRAKGNHSARMTKEVKRPSRMFAGETTLCLLPSFSFIDGNYSAGMADVRQGGTIGLPAKTLVNASMTLPPFLRMVEM